MDKVILSVLKQTTGKVDGETTYRVSTMMGQHLTMVFHFRKDVEDGSLSRKRVMMLFRWSNAFLKELDGCKGNFYPTHRDTSSRFKKYHEEVKRLKISCRKSLEKELRDAISAASIRSLTKILVTEHKK